MFKLIVDIRYLYPDDGEPYHALEVRYGINPHISPSGEFQFEEITDWQQVKWERIPVEKFPYFD